MTIAELLQYCMAKPDEEQCVHNDWKATQIKV
ncbi:MmcQ/YjbR family DNA-binding protein, partial [Enterobacter quasiroggenkampii]|nr:MmcQ/YjbR family DNA-binding protein [Enterobacter quasiroggenkampii]